MNDPQSVLLFSLWSSCSYETVTKAIADPLSRHLLFGWSSLVQLFPSPRRWLYLTLHGTVSTIAAWLACGDICVMDNVVYMKQKQHGMVCADRTLCSPPLLNYNG